MKDCVIPEAAKQLTKAQCLIEDKKHWCKGELRKTKRNGTVTYCAIGSVYQITKENSYGYSPETNHLVNYLNEAADELYDDPCIMSVNDGKGHKAVMRCFDFAVQNLIQEANTK